MLHRGRGTTLRCGRIVLGAATGLGALAGLAWLGLQVQPAPFPPYPGPTTLAESVPLPAGLPEPVARYFRLALGERVPLIYSAVLTGRARLRVARITFPTRLRFIHDAGQRYRHIIESTWFGLPLLRVNETYQGGHARQELPFGVVANEPKVDMAANLALWGESIWLPPVLATDPRVRWEALDAQTARLVVPFGEVEDSFTVAFDQRSGLVQRLEALRYRSATDEAKTPWRLDLLGWRTFHGIQLPSPVAVTWLDEGTPWLVMALEDVAYNVDVAPFFESPQR